MTTAGYIIWTMDHIKSELKTVNRLRKKEKVEFMIGCIKDELNICMGAVGELEAKLKRKF